MDSNLDWERIKIFARKALNEATPQELQRQQVQAVQAISPDDAKKVLASLQNPPRSPDELANRLRDYARVIASLPAGTPIAPYSMAINQIGAALAPILTTAAGKK